MAADQSTKLLRSAVVAVIFVVIGVALGFCDELQPTSCNSKSSNGGNPSRPRLQRPVILVFTGGDWCNYCRRLENEVLLTPEFEEWSKGFIKLVISFDEEGNPSEMVKKNRFVMQLYQDHIEVFPTALFVDVDGSVLGKLGYAAGGPDRWVNIAERTLQQASRLKRPGP
jgi:thioredoxin-related protein